MTLPHDLAGTGPSTVVLLHSGVCDRRMWDGQFHALAGAGHRVVRCDLRGFGDSPMEAPHTHAEDVRELLDHLGVERAAVVGSSFGGRVALELAALHPGRVRALALLGSAMPGMAPSEELRAWGAREDALIEAGDLDAAVELNVDTWLGPEATEAARAVVRDGQRRAFDLQLAAPEEHHPVAPEVTREDLARIRVPALVAVGTHDLPDFRAVADELGSLLPGARRVDVDRAGHLPALDLPEETARLLLSFLAEVSALSPGVSAR
ncbi:alpha/beta fold hydrolase [Streptomyces sp. NK15101]|uniref:alpha/beta fold hydrolase n=1 Tax=Streptomyces sp. NK15101 TaxID=2873261 RepID=UPI001CEC20F0|nr:alpha/beta hydrolase [Streptomyces sp. NK15101]